MTQSIREPFDKVQESTGDTFTETPSWVASTVFWALGLIALGILPFAIKSGRRDLGWFLEPWAWPALALLVALIGGISPVLRLMTRRKDPRMIMYIRIAFSGMGSSLFYALLFLMFLVLVAGIGFNLASLIFVQVLFFVSGLRGRKWLLVGLAISLTIIAAFRVGLDIWFPRPVLLQFLPDWIAISLEGYF